MLSTPQICSTSWTEIEIFFRVELVRTSGGFIMARASSAFMTALGLALATLFAPTAAIGQQVATQAFNRSAYDTIASANSGSIPDGTRITSQNWQQYQKFMSLALRAFFSGRYFWRA